MRWILACVVLSGCAAMSDNECGTANGYEVGRNDARLGNRPSFGMHAARCPREQPSEQEYLAGWAIGYSETSFRQPN
jgi:hypothetical protein